MSKLNRRAWLRTQYALEHHAKALAPIAQALQSALDSSGIFHRSGSSKTGANSRYVELDDGRRFYLRGRMRSGPRPFIHVRQRRTKNEWQLFNERDAIRFVEAL
jgi:hypothetical protein